MENSLTNIVKLLKDHRISVTPQRVEILRVLRNRYDHPSSENLYHEVRQKLPMISFNTVYKTLETFFQKGLVIKINPLHEVARYDGNTMPHSHLICTQCQQVIDMEWQWPEGLPLPCTDKFNFKIQQVSLQLFGLCHNCSSQN
jgi:Fur family transcriptional regulator, peroxide stress response regulator